MEEIIKTEEAQINNQFDQQDNRDPDLTGLAGRGTRLAAAIIDGLILFIPVTVINVLFYGLDGYMQHLTKRNLEFAAINLFVSLLASLVLNGYLLYKNGQTIGKWVMDIKIVDMNNNVPSLFKSYFLRTFLFSMLFGIPFVNFVVMLDPFFIFSQSRRCLHDRLAGTKVVDVEIDED